jgi:hypothetical protein
LAIQSKVAVSPGDSLEVTAEQIAAAERQSRR